MKINFIPFVCKFSAFAFGRQILARNIRRYPTFWNKTPVKQKFKK